MQSFGAKTGSIMKWGPHVNILKKGVGQGSQPGFARTPRFSRTPSLPNPAQLWYDGCAPHPMMVTSVNTGRNHHQEDTWQEEKEDALWILWRIFLATPFSQGNSSPINTPLLSLIHTHQSMRLITRGSSVLYCILE